MQHSRVNMFYAVLLATYVFFLLWLVLFKFSFDVAGVLADYQSRSLNLVPFAGYDTSLREMLDNFLVFVPLGLLLGMVIKHADIWRRLAYIAIFSVAAEITQYALAIGTSDITDVILNTLGGFFGLAAYRLAGKHVSPEKLDMFIAITLTILLAAFAYARFFVLKVQY